ncbi:amidohydrolase [Salipiger aestuarii]|uniref:Hippurate hydrolase n=1 Tax=Salipiger aestuarii TaxID=568098 RepID=A0A327Y443_9RHOB|nr:M20 aminoacylase family protein [Salipiger aestuarii]EIE52960.1 amidohydrolase family protein [Citreicella sp. 357]KAA8606312.1 amidohydrolase [Salipiger aestuarii]KAA8610245.1 amidohydrolase [Salipiger aestuarii]KAB2540961.1 amidohydrolase [Salipiger aestuarii]RAK13149.1 hippurate hydrolase [Salipiger aestuarii]
MPIVNRIADYAEDMKTWRRHLHRHPELSLDCHETARFVVARLREFGICDIHEGIATSGVVALIDGQGDGPVTGLRADMDALPVAEDTGAPYRSTVPGKMHACGHDGHTAMLLGAAKYLSETRNFSGRVALIFQPAEETIGGGRIMVEEGIMERFGIQEVYALHTDPTRPLGEFATRPGPLMAAVDDFELVLTGRGGHAAHPDTCIDPVPAALGIGQALQTIVSRNSDPLGSLVVSLTVIQTGSASNVIPETARLAGTVRSFDPDIRDMAERRIREIVAGQAMSYGLTAHLDYQRNYPPTVNHADQTEFAVTIARGVSASVVDDAPPSMGAEDFSYLLESRPGAFLYLGQGLGPFCHHPKFDFNDEAAPIGASFFARLIEMRHPLRA